MSQSASDGFIAALLKAAGEPDPVRAVEAVLWEWGGERVRLPRRPLRAEDSAADLARRLVFAGVGRGAAVAMLLQRRDISPRHARRLVRAAVDVRGPAMSASRQTLFP